MDELRAFYNNPSPSGSRVIKLRGSQTGGHRITKVDPTDQLNRREDHRRSVVVSGTDYAREIKEKENENYSKNEVEREKWESMPGGLDSMEYLSSWGTSVPNMEELTEEAMTQVYSKYSFQMKEDSNNLAINEFKQQILDQITGFPVVIIEGPTGCGKTTQVPQWILDDAYQHRKPCKIIVTQPRRIAAISIAKRVSQERGWTLGDLVGYQVALESKKNNDTRITYVTSGILLAKLVTAKTMNEYTHIILDEVHERGQEMDFLLLIVKKLLYTVSRNVKVILMSATFDRKAFSDYFLIKTPHGPLKPSSVKVVKKEPMFTVKVFYLNHLNKFGSILQKSAPTYEEPGIAPTMYHLVIKLISAFEQIDMREDNYVDRSEAEIPSVLIFLPGIHEIEELYGCLTNIALRKSVVDTECGTYKWWVLPLHSTITAEEQVRVFHRAPLGHRKIILSTNIAESSITVPDIKYVIDFCLMKVLVADDSTNFTSLQMMWASKTNCEQRAGRAGRVRDGRVYRLVPDKFYENFKQECPPEIVRCPLERLVLLAKMLDMGTPSDVLALAMDPPDMSNIHRTVLVLKEIGAIKKTLEDKWCSFDGDITYLGRVMAKLPLGVRVTKLIVLGYVFGVLDDSIVIAASMSVKNIFSNPFRERLNAFNSKLTWADGSTSDCIAFLNVYRVWHHLKTQQFFKQGGNSEVQWARRFFVQMRALRELDALVKELRLRLSFEGIDTTKGYSPWAKNEVPLILKIIMAGAFYPQYFVQVSSDEDRERDAVRVLGGLDPRNTVYLKNFPDGQPPEVYASAIKSIVKQHIADEPRVTFDKNSQKVFLSFYADECPQRMKERGDPTIPGQVVLPVYKAVKARMLKIDFRLPLLPAEKAEALAKALEESRANVKVSSMVPRLPDIDDTHFPIKVSQLIDVGNFWAQHDDASSASELVRIQNALNRKPLVAYTASVTCGLLVAAPYKDAGPPQYFRAKIVKLEAMDMVEVFFIDYGNLGRVGVVNLRQLPVAMHELCPLALRCRLRGVAPAALMDAHAKWSPEAVQWLTNTVVRWRLIAKVYSVTHGVVTVDLLADSGRLNLNNELIVKGFAVPVEESYESKLNHDLRQTATELNMAQKRAYNKEQTEMAFCPSQDVEPLDYKLCISDAYLKGPFSPLETNLHTLMYASRDKQISIECSSVNSVLLDTTPQETYQRLLIAGDIGQNEKSSRLTLRYTTLMPNIPCLPALVSLLFCPMSELRRHPDGTRYVSVLCGLGCDEEATPRFPEHDLLVDIDADLSVDDIGHINHIRYLMDCMMQNAEEETTGEIIRSSVPSIIRTDLMKLLLKRRKKRTAVSVVGAWEWRSVNENELLEITVPDMVERAVVYPLHVPLELRPTTRDRLLELKRDNDELKMLVARTSISSNVQRPCKLCNTPPMTANTLRIHLYSNAHKDKEEDFRIVQS